MITRICKGKMYAVIFLNKREFTALDRLLDAYLVTSSDNPDLPLLRKVREEVRKK